MESRPRTPHQARKRFGQNFLTSSHVIERIVRTIQPQAADCLIEIGPGLGALTRPLLSACPALQAIELDRDLAAQLRENLPTLQLIEGDALQTNFLPLLKKTGGGKVKITGNLPYNISTPLIFHLLEYRNQVDAMFFMLQKEVVMRMAALPGNKEYGRLSVMTQYACEVTPLFDIAPSAFQPAPKVTSTFVTLVPRKSIEHLENPAIFSQVVNLAFQQRRKTLRNALSLLLRSPLPDEWQARLQQRAEQLSVAEFVRLANLLSAHQDR